MKRLLMMITALLVSGLVLAAGAEAATVNVSVVDFAFSPSSVTINVGDTVVWTLNGSAPHTVTSGAPGVFDGKFNSGTLGSTPFSFTFNTAGSYPYFCNFHFGSGMVGTVVVNAAAQTLPPPSGAQAFFYVSEASPRADISPSTAEPMSIGPLAEGQDLLTLRVQTAASSVALDHYLAVVWSGAPDVIIDFASDGTFPGFSVDTIAQAFATGIPPAGFTPWMPSQSTAINTTLVSNVASANLGAGTYFLFFLDTLPGSLGNFYVWGTDFTVGVPMTVALNGSQEVPATGSAATATGNLAVNFTTGSVLGTMTFSGLSGPATVAHIHQGAAGVNGSPIIPLTGGAGGTSGVWTISGTLSPAQLTALRAGQLYLNIHSANFPNGEIRGQITFPAITFKTKLEGSQEVPAVNSNATASGIFTVDIGTGAVNGTLTFSGLSSAATVAHIHQGAFGVNGSPIIPLTGGAGGTSGTWTISGTLSPAQLAALAADQLYLNIHSANFPNGEIRGQVYYAPGVPLP